MYKIETPKDIRKIIKSAIELAVLLFVLFILLRALFTFTEYVPFNRADKQVVSGEDHGFIALSYFGVDREGTDSLISVDKLNEHLGALNSLGYVTVTQKDVEDYYSKGTPLPDKAVFLMYEDGRNDTAIYAQSIMEKYNYKATMFTYAEKFGSKDSKFLMAKDLVDLEKTGFWELGSNGYRLSYINVFDRYGRYLGELNSNEYSNMARYLGREYTHYLMDFIRDENNLPIESNAGMQSRISGEYDIIKSEYMKGINKVPRAYVLMHANTGAFGENSKVSAVNESCIKDTFAMNYNREGYSFNDGEVDIYNLTRLQPQANWYTNHLLMRVWDDLPENDKNNILFVVGDETQKSHWELKRGAVEYDGKTIALTSLPEDKGQLKLIDNANCKDIKVDVELAGNVLGMQSVVLRANEDLTESVEVSLTNNILYLKQNGQVLEQINLNDFDNIPKISVEEDMRDSLAGEYAALARAAGSYNESQEYKKLQKQAEATVVKSVEEGAKEYEPTMKISDRARRMLSITLSDGKISVKLDNKLAWDNVEVGESEANGIYLESAWAEYGYSQRNIVDDVYDGVFENINITNINGDQVIYTNRVQGVEKTKTTIVDVWNTVVNWFIRNL